MAVLEWDQVGDKRYEAGVSKGVFYKEDDKGVAWNGLTSVEYSYNDSVESVFYDGVKFNDLVTIGALSAKLKAYTYPDEFLEYEGIRSDVNGFYITGQPKKWFGLCYRTEIGDDINGLAAGYKIHILYNLTAVPADRQHETLALDVEPMDFEWDLTSIPEHVEFYRPTSHVILDSRTLDPYLLIDLEKLLYGTETEDATLPSLRALTSYIRGWGRFVITDHGDGTWTAYTPFDDVITMLDTETFQIDYETAVYLDADTYEISSDPEEEVP